MRLLHLPHDKRALSVLAAYDLSRESDLRAAVEAIETHEIAPPGWADHVDLRALPIALRNPRAIVTAERLLRDELTAAVSRAVARGRERIANELRRDGYGGVLGYLTAYSSVQLYEEGYEAARRVPCGRRFVVDDGWTLVDPKSTGRTLPADFALEERHRPWPFALAYAAHLGTEWQRAVYALGLAPVYLYRFDDAAGGWRNRWYLVVRDGEGWELPALVPDPYAAAV